MTNENANEKETDADVPTRNQHSATFEALKHAINAAQDPIKTAEDKLPDDHTETLGDLEDAVEGLKDGVDDAQDATDYSALPALAPDVQAIKDKLGDLQDAVEFDTDDQAEAVEAVEEAVETIENTFTAVRAGYAIVVDNIPLVYREAEQLVEDLMVDSGTEPNKVSQKELVAYDRPDGEKLTTWPNHAEIDLSEDDRTFFEVHPKGSGRS